MLNNVSLLAKIILNFHIQYYNEIKINSRIIPHKTAVPPEFLKYREKKELSNLLPEKKL